jgi:hypothetical protein
MARDHGFDGARIMTDPCDDAYLFTGPLGKHNRYLRSAAMLTKWIGLGPAEIEKLARDSFKGLFSLMLSPADPGIAWCAFRTKREFETYTQSEGWLALGKLKIETWEDDESEQTEAVH